MLSGQPAFDKKSSGKDRDSTMRNKDVSRDHDHTKPPRKRIPVTNARKIWGTLKSTTCATILGAIRKLAPNASNETLTIKRKFKANQEGSTKKWWFMVRGDQLSVELLQSEWPKIATQTGWKLESLLCYDDAPPPSTPVPQLECWFN